MNKEQEEAAFRALRRMTERITWDKPTPEAVARFVTSFQCRPHGGSPERGAWARRKWNEIVEKTRPAPVREHGRYLASEGEEYRENLRRAGPRFAMTESPIRVAPVPPTPPGISRFP